jgi:hypothetical protein
MLLRRIDMPWKPSDHHWIPQKGKWAKEYPYLYEETYKNFTTHLSGEDHQQVQNDEKEVGPIGSIAKYDLRHLFEEDDEE